MTQFKPRPIQIITIEEYVSSPTDLNISSNSKNLELYVKIEYFEYKLDKQGIYRSPLNVFMKQDNAETYHLLAKKEQILQWAEVSTLVDVSLTGRLYRKTE